jgi:cytochrome oxidase Cu insertion factor (SCO1/SenC/PrrC family)
VVARFLAAAALVAVLGSGCGGSSEEASPPPATMEETTAPAVEETAVPAGRPAAPTVDGTSLDGESISLGDFRGRPVLVNVWSSW